MSNPFTLDKSIERSVRFVQKMVAPKYIDVDKGIPRTLISHCEGIAFLKIFKVSLRARPDGASLSQGDCRAPRALLQLWSFFARLQTFANCTGLSQKLRLVSFFLAETWAAEW